MKNIFIILFIINLLGCNENKNGINEMAPSDIYLNLENQGFVTNKNLSTTNGNFWDCKYRKNEIDYQVIIFSTDIHSVESIKATAIMPSIEYVEESKQFFKYVSSVPYGNSDTDKAMSWIDNNYNIDKAETVIGDAKFTIYAPSQFSRMMTIRKK